MKGKGLKATENLGLNPIDPGEGDIAKRSEENPIYLAHILEHNYLVKENNNIHLGGVVIGLALNSIYYYQKEAFGATYEAKIDSEKLEVERQGNCTRGIKSFTTNGWNEGYSDYHCFI